MTNSISRKFNTGSLLKFVWPSMAMMLLIAVYSMVGSIYAGNFIDQNAMAAINIVSPLYLVVIAIAVMFATGANAIIAKNLGEGKTQEAKEKLTYLFIISIITGAVIAVITLIFDDEILGLLGSTDTLHLYAKEYLRTLSFCFPLIFLQIFGQYFTVTIGKPMLGFIFAIISTIANLILTHLTVVNLNMSITGAAIGLNSTYLLPAIIFCVLLFVKKNWALHFVKPKKHKKFMLNVCSNGSSEMVTNLAISTVTIVLNLLMRDLHGENGIAAVTVIASMQFFLNSIYIGFGAGVAPIFAFAQGRKDYDQTKNVFKISIKFVLISSVVLVLISMFFKDFIVGIFIDENSPAFELAINAFSIFSLGYLFAGTNIFSSVFFTSMSNGKISALISFLRTFAFILGMLAILPNLFATTGVWLSIPIAELLAVIVSIALLKKYRSVYHY